MHEKIMRRLDELRRELAAGKQQLALLEQKKRTLADTMHRINGAIQVLEELRGSQEEAESPHHDNRMVPAGTPTG